MPCPETVHAVRSAWLTSAGVCTVFDPEFGSGESFNALLNLPDGMPTPKALLRYVAVCEHPQTPLAPGLHFLNLPQHNAELHLYVGAGKSALAELQGKYDAVMHPDAARQYSRWLRREPSASGKLRSVAVLGAGIAGSSVALALCGQGIQVHLFDQAAGPAAGASGNWVGAFHPHITRGDSPLSRLSRLGFEHTVQALEALSRQELLEKGVDWDTPGHLQTVPPDEAMRTRETLQQLDFPPELVSWAEPDELLPTHLGGLYFPKGGWVKPARWVQANLHACGELLNTHFDHPFDELESLRANFDAVVVCCAEQSIRLAPVAGARVASVKGQITKLRSAVNPALVLSGESYAIAPACEDWMVLGATYERPVLDLNPTAEADALNMARFKAAFPELPMGEWLDHRCAVRSVWHDRLPAIGPVPEMPGVYMSTGFASRGLLWAALGGWIVAGHCMGRPFESKLLGKITPRAAKA
jgi:tRNA 5-methylaminomethyl-2-thiouridine biosynthesis bifunctional protein